MVMHDYALGTRGAFFCFLPQGVVGEVVWVHWYKCLDARGRELLRKIVGLARISVWRLATGRWFPRRFAADWASFHRCEMTWRYIGRFRISA
jgi:hypothetical protein